MKDFNIIYTPESLAGKRIRYDAHIGRQKRRLKGCVENIVEWKLNEVHHSCNTRSKHQLGISFTVTHPTYLIQKIKMKKSRVKGKFLPWTVRLNEETPKWLNLNGNEIGGIEIKQLK
jgi:hypothetical protein